MEKNRIYNLAIRRNVCIAYLWVLLLSITSCDTIRDDYSECIVTYEIKFKYDYNMKWADAFPHEVHSWILYAYDSQGKLAYQLHESGEELAENGYAVKVNFNPSEYHIVVWAGEPNSDSFSLTQNPASLGDVHCTMKTASLAKADYPSCKVEEKLTPMWHGEAIHAQSTIEGLKETTTIPLIKDTNSIKVILQQMDEEALDPSSFEFAITDNNCHLDYKNDIECDHVVEYHPYKVSDGSAENASGNPLNVVVAQLTTSRLIADNESRLTIKNSSTGESLLSIPLSKYLQLTEAEGHNIGAQEYLDRQDEYSLTFFLDKNLHWLSSQIIINDWIVRFNDIKH